jgi:DNA-binding response OmpR family regulator
MAQQIEEITQQHRFSHLVGKVLLVDDDLEELNCNATLFEQEGVTVSKCQLYDTAIRSIEREKFDLLLVDQGSSAFEGRLILRYLRQYQPSTPCVILVRDTSMRTYRQAMELGAADYLQKPLSFLDVNRLLRLYVLGTLTCHDH